MGLESYRDNARVALASFLRHTVTREGRFYGAMLPEEHPFSFCKLLGLSAGERDCLFSACGFFCKGFFSSTKFDQFLSTSVDLQAIQATKTGVSMYDYKKFDIYAIGDFSLGKSQLRTFNQQEQAFGKGDVKTMCIPATHHAGIKVIVKHLLAEAADKENDAMLVDPSDESDKAVAGPPDAGCMDVSVGRKRERVECQGIPHSYLQKWGTSLSPSGLSKLLERFNYINNRWCHKDCTGSFFRLVGSGHGSSCDHCEKGRSSVRKDRLPDLFQCPTAIADICPSEFMLKAAITNAAASFETLELLNNFLSPPMPMSLPLIWPTMELVLSTFVLVGLITCFATAPHVFLL
jgi:hypothetical protein